MDGNVCPIKHELVLFIYPVIVLLPLKCQGHVLPSTVRIINSQPAWWDNPLIVYVLYVHVSRECG